MTHSCPTRRSSDLIFGNIGPANRRSTSQGMIRREQCHQTLRPDKVLSNHRIGEIRHERGKYEIERPLAELAVKFAGHRLDQNEIDFWALGPKDDQCLAKRAVRNARIEANR